MSTIKSYRDLIVWQKSMKLVTEIYQVTRSFPSEGIICINKPIDAVVPYPFQAILPKAMAEDQH